METDNDKVMVFNRMVKNAHAKYRSVILFMRKRNSVLRIVKNRRQRIFINIINGMLKENHY